MLVQQVATLTEYRFLAKTFIHNHLPTMDFCEHPALKRLHGAMRCVTLLMRAEHFLLNRKIHSVVSTTATDLPRNFDPSSSSPNTLPIPNSSKPPSKATRTTQTSNRPTRSHGKKKQIPNSFGVVPRRAGSITRSPGNGRTG